MPPRKPAWSAPFAQDALPALDPIEPIDGITPEWAWEGSTGKGVKVAIIDSGIDATHPVVGGEVNGYVSITEESDDLVYDTDPHEDVYGHGTACAGIIRTFAPDCELYSVRVLGPRLSGRGVVFAAGLRWAIENGMDVCNLSLGTTRKNFFGVFHELADLAYFRNVMLVTAANNMPAPSFPSVYASVISVASHDEKNPYRFYYNTEPPVEFGAPGIDVRVPWQNGDWIIARVLDQDRLLGTKRLLRDCPAGIRQFAVISEFMGEIGREMSSLIPKENRRPLAIAQSKKMREHRLERRIEVEASGRFRAEPGELRDPVERGVIDADLFVDSNRDHRDVVLAASALRLFDQIGRRISTEALQNRRSVLIIDLPVETIGTEEHDISRFKPFSNWIDLERVRDAEGASERVAARVRRGLFRREPSGPYLLLDPGVIDRQLAERTVS